MSQPPDRERVLRNLVGLHGSKAPDEAHLEADAVLCDFLTRLGYADVVEAWKLVPKWYS